MRLPNGSTLQLRATAPPQLALSAGIRRQTLSRTIWNTLWIVSCSVAIAPYREDLGIAVECIFTCYWLADLCAREGLAFVLGHALYMKAIHGGKAKNDRCSVSDLHRWRLSS